MEGLPFDLGPGVAPVAGLLILVVGFLLGRLGQSGLAAERGELREQVARAEAQNREQQKSLKAMQSEFGAVGNLALALAPVVRDLNRNDLERTDAPKLILRLAKGLFDPEQILLYGVRSTNGPHGRVRELRLITYHGLKEVPETLASVPLGTGKIGWVASHEIDRLAEDWKRQQAAGESSVPDNHPRLRADLIGPLLHHSNDGQSLLGVLCIGGPRKLPHDPKLMFQLVTNFGSLALVTASNMTLLRDRAHHDGLTGMLNKRCFLEDRAPKLLLECTKLGRPFSIFIFDIDNFKHFNDHNGHPAGDRLLRELPKVIRQALRPGDLACRYGGEEFVIAMPNTEPGEALQLADRIRQEISEYPFEHREAQPLGTVSISGGVASAPRDSASVDDLLKFADEALYQGKRGGRNRVRPYRGVQIGDADGVVVALDTPSNPLHVER